MAGGTIKLFQFNQKLCHAMGIKLPKPNENWDIYEIIRWIYVTSQILFALALLAFLLYDAKAMGEYGIEFFSLVTLVFSLIVYFGKFCQLKDLLKFIENCERFIRKSKFTVDM